MSELRRIRTSRDDSVGWISLTDLFLLSFIFVGGLIAVLTEQLVNLGEWHFQGRGPVLCGQRGRDTRRLAHAHARRLHAQSGIGQAITRDTATSDDNITAVFGYQGS